MDNYSVYVDIYQGGQMKDVQCKKNRNEVIPVSEAVANHFDLDSVCHSCIQFDTCREEKEQAEIEGE